MAFFILKPTERDGNEYTGPVMTFESNESPTNIINAFISSGTTVVPNAGVPSDVLSDADWYDSGYTGSSVGYGFVLMRVSGIGTNGTGTVTMSGLNASELVSEVLHPSHSNTVNGLAYDTTGHPRYHYNNSAMTISTLTEVTSLDYLSNGQTTFSPNTKARTLNNDNGNVYVNGILYASQTGGGSDDGLAWYQNQGDPNYFDNISQSNFFNNHTDVTNKRKNHRRAMTSLAESTSTTAIEKFTKLMNLKLLDRIIDADDYREAERFALSRLTDSEQTEIKNIIRYS